MRQLVIKSVQHYLMHGVTMKFIGCVLSLVAFYKATYSVFKNPMLWGDSGKENNARGHIFVKNWANK